MNLLRLAWRWLIGADLRDYTFEHEAGPRHTVRARSVSHARRKMRSFLQAQMFGEFALIYNPSEVERELQRCKLIEPPAS